MLRAAIIGLGMGRSHARAYREIAGVEVVAACDVDAGRLHAFASELAIEVVSADYREIVTRDDVDLVSVCSPDHLHFEHCRLALEHGKHVLCEKPMVTTLDDARELVRLVGRTGRKLAVGNVSRFVPQFRLIKQFVEEGRIGELFFVESDYVHDMRRVYRKTPWRIDAVHPQNAWLGGGVHPMDLVRWVAGDVAEITLYQNKCASAPEFPLPDNYISILKFANGCLGKVWETSGIRRWPEHVVNFNAYGSEGTVQTNTLEMQAKAWLNLGIAGQSDALTIPFVATIGHPVRDELQHFVDCIREDRTPLVDVVEGAKTVATLVAGLRSAESGRPEKVPAVD
jgi:predicted dehydrogenase